MEALSPVKLVLVCLAGLCLALVLIWVLCGGTENDAPW